MRARPASRSEPLHTPAPPTVVVDASVALKWALDDEEAVEQAVALRDDGLQGRIRMIAPVLWSYEVANGLYVAARRGRVSFIQGSRALAALHTLGVQLAETEPGDCYALAERHRVAVYDAAYLALAVQVGAELWTGDHKFFLAVAPGLNAVRWIADYEPGSASSPPTLLA